MRVTCARSQTGWQKKVLPATANVTDCPQVEGIWNKYDAWCDAMGVPRANHGIVTVYSDGSMNIDYHYDKIKSIASNSLITIVKTGEAGRPFQIRQRLYAPWADEVPAAQREEMPMAAPKPEERAGWSAEREAKYKADQQRRSAFAKAHEAVKPFFNKVVPPGDALIMTIPANLATEHAVSTVETAAESGSIVLRTTTDVVPYEQALRAAGASAATSTAATSSTASHVPIAVHDALKLKYDKVVTQLRSLTAENRSLRGQVERLLLAAADKCSICQDMIKQRATVNCDAKHAYCKGCIRPWLTTQSSKCPNCNGEVTELRCPPDAEEAESIAPRQQRHPDADAPLDLAAALEREEEFFADQHELRRDFIVNDDGAGGDDSDWAAHVEERGTPEQRAERAQRRRREAQAAEAEAEQDEEPGEMEGMEEEPSALRPRGPPPTPTCEQLKWRLLDSVPEDAAGVFVDGNGVTQQLYDAAVAAGTLLVRTEAEAKEWEARPSAHRPLLPLSAPTYSYPPLPCATGQGGRGGEERRGAHGRRRLGRVAQDQVHARQARARGLQGPRHGQHLVHPPPAHRRESAGVVRAHARVRADGGVPGAAGVGSRRAARCGGRALGGCARQPPRRLAQAEAEEAVKQQGRPGRDH